MYAPGVQQVSSGQSVNFPSTSPGLLQGSLPARSHSFRPELMYGAPTLARAPAQQQSDSISGRWAPVTQVLKSRIVPPSQVIASDSQGVPARLRPEGGDLGPQVSRSANTVNTVDNRRRNSANKPSLAAFASSQPAPAQRSTSTGLVRNGMPDRSSEPSVRNIAMGSSYDDNDLPTLRELVKVGTAGATSSTASANRRTGSLVSPAPTWLGMGAGQPGRYSDGQELRQDVRPNEAVIALDVDEVLVQYVGGFRKYMQQERPNGPLDTDSIFHEAHNPTSPWRLQFALSGGLDNLEAVPGAAAALQRLRHAGIRLEAVTSRPPIMRQSTEALLAKLFAPDTFAAYHFVGPGEKGRTCNAIGARALVDDQFPNCVDACGCGVTCILFDYCGSYPWSQNLPEMPPNCKRCETWVETCTFLLAQFGIRTGREVQSSEYLLQVKQAVAVRSDPCVDYRDALSEAEKQPTEYDLDMDDGASREAQRWAKATDQAPRSESWWQMRDDPPPQTSPALQQTTHRVQSHHREEEGPRSEPWWQMRDEPSLVSPQTSFQFSNLIQTMPPQETDLSRSRVSAEEYGYARPAFQQSQTNPTLQQSQPRREPLSMRNGPASSYVSEPQKAQVRATVPRDMRAELTEHYGGYQTSPYALSTYAKAPQPLADNRVTQPNRVNAASVEEDSMCTIT